MTTAFVEEPVVEQKKSTHRVEVVPLILDKHPNADLLSVAKVYGFTCVTATDQWKGINKAAYLPPDSVVDISRPEFSFLAKDAKADGKVRIKAKKLRGVLSFGLLVPAPDDVQIGDDIADRLGVTHYEPPIRNSGGQKSPLFGSGEVAPGPNLTVYKYDLDAGRRYASLVFRQGEPVVVSEKIHGCNSRYVFHNGQMYCGSKTEWKREYPDYSHITVESLEGKVAREKAEEIVNRLQNGPRKQNLWWQALDATPTLRAFCEQHPDTVVYGEVYGAVQDLRYGCGQNEVRFAAFDVMRDGRYLDALEAERLLSTAEVPLVPKVAEMEYDFDRICELAEGDSLIPNANHIREGVVVVPVTERYDSHLGRVKLKWVSAAYLERSK